MEPVPVQPAVAKMAHEHAVQMTCPHCQQPVVTRVAFIPGLLTWIVSGVMGVCMCCCICTTPFFVDGLQDAEHYCPNCNVLLGVFRRW